MNPHDPPELQLAKLKESLVEQAAQVIYYEYLNKNRSQLLPKSCERVDEMLPKMKLLYKMIKDDYTKLEISLLC